MPRRLFGVQIAAFVLATACAPTDVSQSVAAVETPTAQTTADSPTVAPAEADPADTESARARSDELCVLSMEEMSAVVGVELEDEGWSSRCARSPVGVFPGDPMYVGIDISETDDQTVEEWRARLESDGYCNGKHEFVARPDLGEGAFESRCRTSDDAEEPFAGSADAAINVPRGEGRWALVVMMRSGRVTSPTAASDMANRLFEAIRAAS